MYIFHCIGVTKFELHLYNWSRVLHAVDSKKKVKKSKAIVSADQPCCVSEEPGEREEQSIYLTLTLHQKGRKPEFK